MRKAFALIAALVLASCVEKEPPLPENMTAAEQAQCVAEGGAVQRDGEGSFQVCHKSFTDGGKVCRKGTDCQGLCLADGEASVRGTCAPRTIYYGCNWWFDDDGKVTGGACID